MSRSIRKGPYVDEKLMKKINRMKSTGNKQPIKTWARGSQIPPEFVGFTFLIHNGKDFKEVYITEAMVGHRLGEFSPTRNFRGHGRMVKRILSKT
jgi:small subunit ribosomal protein S19